MLINYNYEKLISVLEDFYHVTGISISICDTQLRSIANNHAQGSGGLCCLLQQQQGTDFCRRSDRRLFDRVATSHRPEVHHCAAGLLDMCVPLLFEDRLLGYMIMGRIRTDEQMPSALCTLLSPEDRARAEALYRALPLYTEERAASAANLAAMLASYILSEGMILPQKSEEAERLIAYVDAHLQHPLSAAHICRDTHLSKSMLYRLFLQHFRCGVNEYITARRLERARELLAKTDLPACEIAFRVGLPNYTYFCRLFKKKTGHTPLQYRKNSR